MSDNENRAAMLVCAADCEQAVEANTILEQRLRAAFKRSRGFWMSGNPEVHFKGALAAVIKSCDEEERKLLIRSIEHVGKLNVALNAATQGVVVDWESIPQMPDALPLVGWFREEHDA